MNKKNPEKGTTQLALRSVEIVKAEHSGVVWDHANYERELKKAKEIGPEKMTDSDLLNFCREAHGYFQGHYWVDAAPFFIELWKRIKRHELPEVKNSKSVACQKIGCSIRWAQMIVKGTAKYSNAGKAKKKQTEGEVTSPADLTTKDYVREILKDAFAKLKPLRQDHWDRYRAICRELAKHFFESSKTSDAEQARAAEAD